MAYEFDPSSLTRPDRNGNVFSEEAAKSFVEQFASLGKNRFNIPINNAVTGLVAHDQPNIRSDRSYMSFNRVLQEPLGIEAAFIETASVTEFMRGWHDVITKAMGVSERMLYDGATTTATVVEQQARTAEAISKNIAEGIFQQERERFAHYTEATLFNRHRVNGLVVQVVPSWVWGWRLVYCTQPPVPPRGKRKGTRKQWKRANPRGWRNRYGPIEPDHVLESFGVIYCTEKQFELIKQNTEELPKRGSWVSVGFSLDSVPYMDRDNTYYEGGTFVVPHHREEKD